MPTLPPPEPALVKGALQRLAEREAQLDYGAVALVQAHDGHDPRLGPPLAVPGFTWQEVDACLKFLRREGLVHSGSVREGELPLGIHFGGLTVEGRDLLARLDR